MLPTSLQQESDAARFGFNATNYTAWINSPAGKAYMAQMQLLVAEKMHSQEVVQEMNQLLADLEMARLDDVLEGRDPAVVSEETRAEYSNMSEQAAKDTLLKEGKTIAQKEKELDFMMEYAREIKHHAHESDNDFNHQIYHLDQQYEQHEQKLIALDKLIEPVPLLKKETITEPDYQNAKDVLASSLANQEAKWDQVESREAEAINSEKLAKSLRGHIDYLSNSVLLMKKSGPTPHTTHKINQMKEKLVEAETMASYQETRANKLRESTAKEREAIQRNVASILHREEKWDAAAQKSGLTVLPSQFKSQADTLLQSRMQENIKTHRVQKEGHEQEHTQHHRVSLR